MSVSNPWASTSSFLVMPLGWLASSSSAWRRIGLRRRLRGGVAFIVACRPAICPPVRSNWVTVAPSLPHVVHRMRGDTACSFSQSTGVDQSVRALRLSFSALAATVGSLKTTILIRTLDGGGNDAVLGSYMFVARLGWMPRRSVRRHQCRRSVYRGSWHLRPLADTAWA